MDYTQLSDLMDCPERYRLRYNEALRKIADDYRDFPRAFGIAIHSALEAYYKGGSVQDMLKAFSGSYQLEVPEDEKIYTMPNGITFVKGYPAWAKANDPQDWKILATERIYRAFLDEAKVFEWEGKLDLVYETSSGIWARDHKTTTSNNALTPMWWRKFDPNPQVSGQAFLLQKEYGQCSGVEISAFKLGYRSRMYKGEPPGFWMKPQKNIFNRNPEQIEDFKQNAIRWQRRLIELEISQPVSQWPKNETQCLFCDFSELCRTVQDPQYKLLAYEKHDPYEYLKGKQSLPV